MEIWDDEIDSGWRTELARYEHLPIYKKSFDLAVFLEQAVSGFARRHKYGLGARLQSAAQDVLVRVVRVQNSSGDMRVSELNELRVEIEALKGLLNLAKEVQAFKSFNSYLHSSGIAVELGRQTEGWLKSCSAPRAPESRPANPQGGRS
ncbi:MAG: four helix bundle protein [Deltaproteobacteria bacterium]|nr:four helix bundle protein [Deltaproteobacteria bacterium]